MDEEGFSKASKEEKFWDYEAFPSEKYNFKKIQSLFI